MNMDSIYQTTTNVLLLATVLFIVYYMFYLMLQRRKKEHLLNLHKKKNSAQKLGDRVKFVQTFYKEVDSFLAKRGQSHIADIVFYSIMGFSLVIAIAMIFAGQFVLAILYPVIFVWFIRKMMKISNKNPVVEMEEELPNTIDNMIRIFSKYADIKTIIYETSLTAKGSLHKELDLLSRQLNTRSPIAVLEEFSEKYNSVWMNNFGFTLIGYLRETSKEETIRNLRHLRTILEKENKTKKSAISERKPSLMINYSLAVIGVVGAILNIIFNPQGFDFFFHSYSGLIVFTLGFGCIMSTIYMNIKMMQIDK